MSLQVVPSNLLIILRSIQFVPSNLLAKVSDVEVDVPVNLLPGGKMLRVKIEVSVLVVSLVARILKV